MRVISITKRILKELIRDKGTLIIMLIGPLVILALFSYIFNVNTTTNVTIGTVNVTSSLNQRLEDTSHVSVKKYSSVKAVKKAIKEEKVDSSLVKNGHHYNATYSNTDTGKTNLAKSAFQAAQTKSHIQGLTDHFAKLQKSLPPALKAKLPKSKKQKKVKIYNHYNYGSSKSTFFDKLMPIMIGFFIFFFVVLVSGMALLNERTSGTLERLLATPVKRSEIVAGYMISYGIIAVIQTLLVILFSITVLKTQIIGSIWLVILTAILLALVALALGIFMSTFAKSPFQMIQFIPIIVVPQIFFSGIIPLKSMANWAQWIANILPMKYAAESLTNVIMKGETINQIAGDLIALLIFIVVLTIFNVIGLKRYRKV